MARSRPSKRPAHPASRSFFTRSRPRSCRPSGRQHPSLGHQHPRVDGARPGRGRGIGIILQGAIDMFNWQEAATVLIAILALVIVGEFMFVWLRKKII